jgi:hypothetical protein
MKTDTHSPQHILRQTNWIVILLLASVTCSLQISCSNKKPVADEDTPPWSTVIALYEKAWDSEQSAFFNPENTARTFAPPLSNLIQTAVNRNKLANLEFDPLYHTNNSEIKNLNIARPVSLAADQRRIEVTFFNLNEPVKIQVDVIMMPTGEWKIANLRYPDNTDLISQLNN